MSSLSRRYSVTLATRPTYVFPSAGRTVGDDPLQRLTIYWSIYRASTSCGERDAVTPSSSIDEQAEWTGLMYGLSHWCFRSFERAGVVNIELAVVPAQSFPLLVHPVISHPSSTRRSVRWEGSPWRMNERCRVLGSCCDHSRVRRLADRSDLQKSLPSPFLRPPLSKPIPTKEREQRTRSAAVGIWRRRRSPRSQSAPPEGSSPVRRRVLRPSGLPRRCARLHRCWAAPLHLRLQGRRFLDPC